MTDEYLEARNNPAATAIAEVNVLKFDSLLHYPINEILVSLYWIINRKTLKPPTKESFVKVYFGKYNEQYTWKVMKDPTLAEYSSQDTMILKKDTWYKIRDEIDRAELYFLWKGDKGNYVTLKKPLPGPGPW
jgi:hypothetical protein